MVRIFCRVPSLDIVIDGPRIGLLNTYVNLPNDTKRKEEVYQLLISLVYHLEAMGTPGGCIDSPSKETGLVEQSGESVNEFESLEMGRNGLQAVLAVLVGM